MRLRLKDRELLTDKEYRELEGLVNKFKSLNEELVKENTYERVSKLVESYLRSINKHRHLLEGIIERVTRIDTELGVQVSELITEAQEWVLKLRNLNDFQESFKELVKKLSPFLNHYGVKLDLKLTINYHNMPTIMRGHKIIFDIESLSVQKLLELILEMFELDIKAQFLNSESDFIRASIVQDFINGVNREELKLALNEDPRHADFLIKAYVVLEQRVNDLKSLAKYVNDNSNVSTETELNYNLKELSKDLKETAFNLRKALELIKESRVKGVITERLISLYNENELLKDTELMVKSYLRFKFKISDLLEQVAYDYLSKHGEVPDYLIDYLVFQKRSPYLFLKSFFS